MSFIIIGIVLGTLIPAGVWLLYNFLRAVRTAVGGEALRLDFDPEAVSGDESIDLTLTVGPNVKKVTVERIILERDFAGRVLAQAPKGFRMRAPEEPPSYQSFEADLDELRQKHKYVTSLMIEREKRAQYEDVLEAWRDLKESVVIWQGRRTIRHGEVYELTIPMRTDVAASGSFTFIYSYRPGIMRASSSASVEYRPRLIALHG